MTCTGWVGSGGSVVGPVATRSPAVIVAVAGARAVVAAVADPELSSPPWREPESSSLSSSLPEPELPRPLLSSSLPPVRCCRRRPVVAAAGPRLRRWRSPSSHRGRPLGRRRPSVRRWGSPRHGRDHDGAGGPRRRRRRWSASRSGCVRCRRCRLRPGGDLHRDVLGEGGVAPEPEHGRDESGDDRQCVELVALHGSSGVSLSVFSFTLGPVTGREPSGNGRSTGRA